MADGLVLDAFALLAYLQEEPGHARVLALLEDAASGQASLSMCTVNLGEVLYWLERRRGGAAAYTLATNIRELPIHLVDADLDLTVMAARVKAAFPVSLADAYAAALAQRLDTAVLTGDPDFQRLEGTVPIQWLAEG
jgi:predicted nucleic acid-binding protein